MSIERADIEKVANLSRIALSEGDTVDTTNRINRILQLVDQLQAVNTGSVTPMAHPMNAIQILREDDVTETNQREAFQKMAPAIEDGLYLVPRVID